MNCLYFFKGNNYFVIFSNRIKQKSYYYLILSFFYFVALYVHNSSCESLLEFQPTKKNLIISDIVNHIVGVEYELFEKRIHNFTAEYLDEITYNHPEICKRAKPLLSTDKKKHKNLQDIKKILSILEKIQNTYLCFNEKNDNYIRKFLEKTHEFLNDGLSALESMRKSLFDVTGNSQIYHKNIELSFYEGKEFNDALISNDTNDTLQCILWIFFIYDQAEKIYEIDDNTNIDEYLLLYAYPIIRKKNNLTFNKIRFNETLAKYFLPYLKTDYGKSILFKSEKYTRFPNEEIAYIQINKKNIFIDLLSQKENNNERKEIENLFHDIAAICEQMNNIERGYQKNYKDRHFLYRFFNVPSISLTQYLSEYIPSNYPPLLTGKNSSVFLYEAYSFAQFYHSGWMSPLNSLMTMKTKYWESGMSKIDNPFTRSTPLISCFIPYLSEPKYETNLSKQGIQYLLKGNFDPEVYRNGVLQSGSLFTIRDTILKYQHWTLPFSSSTLGAISSRLPYILGSIHHLFSAGFDTWVQKKYIQSILSQTQCITNFYTFFNLLQKLVNKSKLLLEKIEKLYKKNNLPTEYMISEFLDFKAILLEKNKNFELIKKVLQKNNSLIKKVTNFVIDFFLPGRMAHFYFNDLAENKEIEILKHFISSLDISFSKIKLLELSQKENFSEYIFNIPTILNPHTHNEITFQGYQIWYPMLQQKPVKNTILLENGSRNMMIVSPVAGGKTVFLSTILTTLYLANLGIIPGEKLVFTYFRYIIDHLEHQYDIGSGLSQHLAERQSMQEVKHIAQMDASKKLIIIDEIYKGTIPTLAVQEAFLDLPSILDKENVITIITTHFPEITKITDNKAYSIKLYYLKVNCFAGIFEKTFQVYPDDSNNWWIRDFQLSLKYQLSQKK